MYRGSTGRNTFAPHRGKAPAGRSAEELSSAIPSGDMSVSLAMLAEMGIDPAIAEQALKQAFGSSEEALDIALKLQEEKEKAAKAAAAAAPSPAPAPPLAPRAISALHRMESSQILDIWAAEPGQKSAILPEYKAAFDSMCISFEIMGRSAQQQRIDYLKGCISRSPLPSSFRTTATELVCKAFDLAGYGKAAAAAAKAGAGAGAAGGKAATAIPLTSAMERAAGSHYASIPGLADGYPLEACCTLYSAFGWERPFLHAALRELIGMEDPTGLQLMCGLIIKGATECNARKRFVFSAILARLPSSKELLEKTAAAPEAAKKEAEGKAAGGAGAAGAAAGGGAGGGAGSSTAATSKSRSIFSFRGSGGSSSSSSSSSEKKEGATGVSSTASSRSSSVDTTASTASAASKTGSSKTSSSSSSSSAAATAPAAGKQQPESFMAYLKRVASGKPTPARAALVAATAPLPGSHSAAPASLRKPPAGPAGGSGSGASSGSKVAAAAATASASSASVSAPSASAAHEASSDSTPTAAATTSHFSAASVEEAAAAAAPAAPPVPPAMSLATARDKLFYFCVELLEDMKDRAFKTVFLEPTKMYYSSIGDEIMHGDVEVHGANSYLAILLATLGVRMSRTPYLSDDIKGIIHVLGCGEGMQPAVKALWADEAFGNSWEALPSAVRRKCCPDYMPANSFIFNESSYASSYYTYNTSSSSISTPKQLANESVDISKSAEKRERLAAYLQQFAHYFGAGFVLPRLISAILSEDSSRAAADRVLEELKKRHYSGSGGKEAAAAAGSGAGAAAEVARLAASVAGSTAAVGGAGAVAEEKLSSSASSSAAASPSAAVPLFSSDPEECPSDVRYWLWDMEAFPPVLALNRAAALLRAVGVVKGEGEEAVM